jgi:hypothetical protein
MGAAVNSVARQWRVRAALAFAFAVGIAAIHGPVLAHKAHEHGAATLELAVDAGRVTVELSSPLDGLVGFERAPRTDAERKAVDAAIAALRQPEALFRFDPAAQCTPKGVELAAPKLGLGGTVAGAGAADGAGEEHGDLQARYELECKGRPPAFVEVGLFESFRRLSRIDVQWVTPKAQGKVSLKRPAKRVELAR